MCSCKFTFKFPKERFLFLGVLKSGYLLGHLVFVIQTLEGPFSYWNNLCVQRSRYMWPKHGFSSVSTFLNRGVEPDRLVLQTLPFLDAHQSKTVNFKNYTCLSSTPTRAWYTRTHKFADSWCKTGVERHWLGMQFFSSALKKLELNHFTLQEIPITWPIWLIKYLWSLGIGCIFIYTALYRLCLHMLFVLF